MAYINGKEILFSSKIGIDGEGGESATLITKEITENGTHNAIDEGADGFSSVNVNVPMPTIIEAPLPITENGTYTAQMVGADGISKIIVDVESSGGGSTFTQSAHATAALGGYALATTLINLSALAMTSAANAEITE